MPFGRLWMALLGNSLKKGLDVAARDPVLRGRMKAFEQSVENLEDDVTTYVRNTAKRDWKTIEDIPDSLPPKYRKIAVDVIKQKGGVK